ncbi:putative sugar phosphate/phosphate translocator [Acorus calamus]|uniref:Sugar phosphate/phosphate translocator n=1 Tax=Acorus calamus TaxID=4465 RepID=A0AAV9DK08_ACOCL|nr:putative sugar phosphate/phosphate translocator [Acorus calamus]
MLKALMPVAVYPIGEARFDIKGVTLQLGAIAFEATRLVLIQILLNLNPIHTLYYVAPCYLVFLFMPWMIVEFPLLKQTSSFHFDYFIFGTNLLCAFALNLAVFLIVGKTSALTMNVAGVVKDWILIA